MELDRYAVFGNPVKHSRSPWIHSQFALQTGQELTYTAQEIVPEEFEKRVLAFFAEGGAGLNITVPFKERAWGLARQRSEAATRAGAVNTLFQDAQGVLHGDNTDGVGLLRDITANHQGVISGKSILILGAGGAVRGILPILLGEGPASVCIANRTVEKAQMLAREFSSAGNMKGVIEVRTYPELQGHSYELIINGTSAGLGGDLPPLPDSIVSTDTWCYDMIYGRGPTVFQQWATRRGAARSLDGVGMLVEQAAEAFWLWRGVRPATQEVIAALRQELQ